MNIRLKPETEEWLKAQVAEGRYESVEDAVEMLVVDAKLNQAVMDGQDWSWAKPYIDEGLAALEAGDVIPAEEVYAEIRARFARAKRT